MATLAANTHQSEVQKAAASMVTMLKFGGDGQNRFVLAEAHHGQWFVGSGGVSTYMTRPKLRVSSAYSILDK